MELSMIADTPISRTLVAAAVGAAAGTHASIWGMYKDAIHEGFSPLRFSRSIFVGAVVGPIALWVLHINPFAAGALVVVFGLAYALERGVTEVWKTFVRNEDQSKYFIPMQFAVLGAPVKSRARRAAAGVGYVSIVVASVLALVALDRNPSVVPHIMVVAVAGFLFGGITALGGAWKDAPKEGFEKLKFFRSPLLTAGLALIVSLFTGSVLQSVVAAFGFERACSETYKTFFFPSRPRGKFAGKPVVYPEMLQKRRPFVPVYVAIWIGVLIAGVSAQ
jgi:hypothetical protein